VNLEYCDTSHPSTLVDKFLRIIGLRRFSYPRIKAEALKHEDKV
jgi:hypothetical protein